MRENGDVDCEYRLMGTGWDYRFAVFDARRHHRRTIRVAGFDYRDNGSYFVTVCTHDRDCLFGDIRNGVAELNEIGRVVADCLEQIPSHYPGIAIHASVVMPNHVHALLHIGDAPSNGGGRGVIPNHAHTSLPIGDVPPGDGRGTACRAPTATTVDGSPRSFGKPQSRSLSTVIGAFKSACTKRIRESCGFHGSVWQRNFHEHIVRDSDEYERIERYIRNNPAKWPRDRNTIR